MTGKNYLIDTVKEPYTVENWLLDDPEWSCKKFAEILDMPMYPEGAVEILSKLRDIYDEYEEDLKEYIRDRGADPYDEP